MTVYFFWEDTSEGFGVGLDTVCGGNQQNGVINHRDGAFRLG